MVLPVVGQQSKKVDKLALHFTSTVTFIRFSSFQTDIRMNIINYNVQRTMGFTTYPIHLWIRLNIKTNDMRMVMCAEFVFIFIIRCVEIHLIYYSIKGNMCCVG